jgi:hypothetical protein
MPILFLFALTLFFSFFSAKAVSENIIHEFPFNEGGGTRLSDIQEPAYLTTYYAYTNDNADINISASIFEDFHLTEFDVGKTYIIYAYDRYPEFITFVDNLTNGSDNRFQKAYTFCDTGGGAEVGDESSFFGHLTQNGIDFEGYRVNSISLHIDELTIDRKDDWYDYHIAGKYIFDVTLLDENSNGVPDGQELAEQTDLDSNGSNDLEQSNMRCLNTPDGERQLCVKIPAEATSFGLIRTVHPEALDNQTEKPVHFPYGLISFRMEVEKGANIQLPVYFSGSLPAASRWYKYDPAIGWLDYTEFVEFGADQKSVVISLTEGGKGDIDGRENTVIIDPSGAAVSADEQEGGSGDGSGCFIKSSF